MGALMRGLTAGAVGTTVLDAVTYLDMALTGRGSSDAPAQTVDAALEAVGAPTPSQANRDEALGALSGLGTGVLVGAAASYARSSGLRLPLLAEGAVIGVGAMAATDGPMGVLGVSDLTGWSGQDWVRDLVPHLAYGVAVAGTLRGLEERDDEPVRTSRPPARQRSLLLRSLAIGIATGARSSLGLVPPGVAAPGAVPAVLAAGAVGTELVFDKLPSTPSRIGQPTVVRAVTGAIGAGVLGREHGSSAVGPAAIAGATGAVVGTAVGAVWRDFCAQRGWDRVGAVVEDAASLALTAWAVKS